jgi:hypothetical protein
LLGTSEQLYVVHDGAIDGTTFHPRRIVVGGITDNTTLRVVRLGNGLNHTSWETFDFGSNVMHSVVIDAFQTFGFEVGGTLTLEQLADGGWSTGDPIGIVTSKPVSVILVSSVDDDQDVVAQLESVDRWGNTFVIHRPIVTPQQTAGRLRTLARIVGKTAHIWFICSDVWVRDFPI